MTNNRHPQSQGPQVPGICLANRSRLLSGTRRVSYGIRELDIIVIRDVSSSMHGQKAADADAASRDFVAVLADPANRDAFSVGVVDFSSSAKIVHPITKATALAGNVIPMKASGNTNITGAIEMALGMLRSSTTTQQQGQFRPVGLLFSDGCHNVSVGPKDVARDFKQVADLVTIAFGSDADEVMLRELASTPQHFYRCTNGAELRAFLPAVARTLSQSIASGNNPASSLGNV